ncbi:uncharacterized protein LOC121369106 [Gigantopelta aegis]|uniref:uncharacterized protein LOC121369106 n=1 Tax=Gigantopelta aegis TaxID=1735272 RepID=UPI001B889199|nr:uncharacterized protein LOC121369106 [Gigantopelta aegis]
MTAQTHELNESVLLNVKHASVSHCWSRIKNDVLRDIGASDFIAVPYIQDNTLYNVGAVVLKKHKVFKDLFSRSYPDALPVTTLENLIKPDNPTPPDVLLGLTSSTAVTRDPELTPDHSFKLVHRGDSLDERRKISLKLKDVHVLRLQNANDTTGVVISLDAYVSDFQITKLYLVYEVIYASEFVMTVISGEARHQYKLDTPTPVGFKLNQYTVSAHATLAEPRDVTGTFRVRWRSKAGFATSISSMMDDYKDNSFMACLISQRKKPLSTLMEEETHVSTNSEGSANYIKHESHTSRKGSR